MVSIARGEVWLVELDPTVGSEIKKTRPAVVVSNDSANQFGPRVVVVPVTSNVSRNFPGDALVSIAGRQGRALGDQLRSLDKARLLRCVGKLPADELRAVDEALRITLGL